jgi:hypothetical protein
MRTVGEVMTRDAAVVMRDGEPLGMFTGLDALRLLARDHGQRADAAGTAR